MATVKYRINVRKTGMRSGGIDSPMRATLEATVQAYKDWGKRPTEGWHILECGVRDTNGEWGFLNEFGFKRFLALCDQEGFPEMWECRHRWDNSGENIYE